MSLKMCDGLKWPIICDTEVSRKVGASRVRLYGMKMRDMIRPQPHMAACSQRITRQLL